MDDQHTGGRRSDSRQVRFDDRGGWWSALACSPMRARAFVRLHWARLATGVLLLVSLLVQCWAVWAAFELIDLYVSCVELWAELARKHLELTLS